MLLTLMALMNAKLDTAVKDEGCRVYCISYADTGEYREGNCACIKLVPYDMATRRAKPKALPTYADKPTPVKEDDYYY